MWRCLFNVVAAVSLSISLVIAGLWARGPGHFEEIHIRHAKWPSQDEVHTYFLGFSWYSNTLRLRVAYLPLTASYFKKHGSAVLERTRKMHGYRPGWGCAFIGENVTRFMAGHRPGFAAHKWTKGNGDLDLVLAVRPWLPTLLASVFPLAWLFHIRRARHPAHFWQFSLRELLITATVISVLLGVAIWLKN